MTPGVQAQTKNASADGAGVPVILTAENLAIGTGRDGIGGVAEADPRDVGTAA